MERVINYGVIGTGAVFEAFQIDALHRVEGLSIKAVCDIDKERLDSVREKYKIPECYTDYRELLKDNEIDVVMVNLPQHAHRDVSVEAARAGKHLYVEKPISTVLSDAKDIIEACKENCVKLCVGHQRRFITTDMKVKEFIDQGYLGKIYRLRAVACWFENLQNLLSKEWWYKKEYGGGPLMRWGVHKTDSMRYLLQKDATEVYAQSGQFVHTEDRITVEDTLIALYRFEDGILGELNVSNSQHEWGFMGEYIELWGEKGTLRYWPSEGKMHIYIPETENPFQNSYQKLTIRPDGMEMVRIHQAFIESIRNDTNPPVSGEDGYRALEMVIGAYWSAEKGKPVKLPLIY